MIGLAPDDLDGDDFAGCYRGEAAAGLGEDEEQRQRGAGVGDRAAHDEAARQLGYRAPQDKAAAGASEGKYIALMVPLLKRPFYNEVLSGISDVAANNGYTAFVTVRFIYIKVSAKI